MKILNYPINSLPTTYQESIMHISRLFFILLAILAVANFTQSRLEVLRAWRHPEPSQGTYLQNPSSSSMTNPHSALVNPHRTPLPLAGRLRWSTSQMRHAQLSLLSISREEGTTAGGLYSL
jgi:hypothetical protein